MEILPSLELLNSNIIISENFIVSLSDVLMPGKTLLVTSAGFSRRGLVSQIVEQFQVNDFVVYDTVTPNPELADLKKCLKNLLPESIVQVIALGGGSVIDSAKVLACLLANPDIDIELEILLQSPSDELRAAIPLVAIPTTSGTGAEVTPFATIWDSATQKKYSLGNVSPTIAILDASLTLSLPLQETLYPALDALSHSLESLWNINRTEQSQEYATQAIEHICESLPQVIEQPQNLLARKKLQQAATFAGLAISQTKTAIAHAISYPLTVRYGVPHGLACSFTLAAILREVGGEKLNLSPTLVDNTLILLEKLALGSEMTKFVDWQTLMEQFDPTVDPSRAGNFTVSIDSDWLVTIIRKSQQLKISGEVHET